MNELGPFELDTIVCGDCLEVMRQMPDSCVDLAFADPPYFVGYRYGDKKDTEMDALPYHDMLDEMLRVCSGPVCITPGIVNIWKLPPADWVLGRFKFGPRAEVASRALMYGNRCLYTGCQNRGFGKTPYLSPPAGTLAKT